jgi:ribosomal-protein-alanine N-acetyltransferase
MAMQAIHTNLPGAVVATARLQLKELTPETLSTIITTYSDEGIMQCLGLVTNDELALEKHKFAQGLTMYRISFKHFLIIESTTGNVIGRIGYHWWHVPHSRAEIGYALAADEHKGKGYMTEAIRAVVAYGFNVMGLNRIEAFIGSRNEPSLRLVQRLGFTREGLMREHYCKNEVIEDSVCFSLLKREFVSK